MAMTDVEIEGELAALGLDRTWRELGVVDEDWLTPGGHWRTMFRLTPAQLASRDHGEVSALIEQAVFGYLRDREALDDATLARLLEAAADATPRTRALIADWDHLAPGQLAQIVAHPALDPAARRLATQKLRLAELATAADDVALDVVRLEDAGDRPPDFMIHGFEFVVLARHRLAAADARQVGALIAQLPRAEQARCHLPAFGLELDAGAPDAVRASICFQCNNLYLDGGGSQKFDAHSDPARELRALLKALAG